LNNILKNYIASIYCKVNHWSDSYKLSDYKPLLYHTVSKSGRFFLIDSLASDSRESTLIAARWLKNAQPIGVEKINIIPQKIVWIGAFIWGYFFRNPFLSRWFIRTGVNAIKFCIKLSNFHKGFRNTYSCQELPWQFDWSQQMKCQRKRPSLKCRPHCSSHPKERYHCATPFIRNKIRLRVFFRFLIQNT